MCGCESKSNFQGGNIWGKNSNVVGGNPNDYVAVNAYSYETGLDGHVDPRGIAPLPTNAPDAPSPNLAPVSAPKPKPTFSETLSSWFTSGAEITKNASDTATKVDNIINPKATPEAIQKEEEEKKSQKVVIYVVCGVIVVVIAGFIIYSIKKAKKA